MLAPGVIGDLQRRLGSANVLTAEEDLITYSFDGTAALRQMPGCVVFAATTQEVREVLKFANAAKIAVVTRGSGTGLSGGSLPSPDCIVLCTVKMAASWNWTAPI
jgi:glycolate oxidase